MSQEEIEQRLWKNLHKWSLQKSTLKFPNKKYNIIYADPPWKYKESWGNGSNEHTYPTMDTEAIKNLPVKNIS